MKFLLVSPREPSGATWLINCLLESGIKTYRRQDPNWMWHYQGNHTYKLNPEEKILQKWLPILSRKASFVFRDDIEVQWTHEWPIREYSALPVIYFIRDPRDSMHSRYKREAPNISFTDFLEIPDPETLLHKIDNWVLFNQYWLQRKNLNVFRFEDYKQDAGSTLSSILEYMKFKPDPESFQMALSESTSDKARKSEFEYRKINTFDNQIINRGGAVSEWKKLSQGNYRIAIDEIEIKSQNLLTRFNYETRGLAQAGKKITVYPNVTVLPFFSKLEFISENILKYENTSNSASYLAEFSKSLNVKRLKEGGLSSFETAQLLDNLIFLFQFTHDVKLLNKIRVLKLQYGFEGKSNDSWNLKQFVPNGIKKIIKKINF